MTDPRLLEVAAEEAADPVMAGATVLVVDDHPPNCILLKRILTKAGVADVHTTGDPLGVVELVEHLRPDLVLLDLHMPGMDGVAVMGALAAVGGADEHLPVIVLTADATSAARDRVLEAGATDFLTKPVDRSEVVLRVRNHLKARALHARLQIHNRELENEVETRRRVEEEARVERAEKERRIRAILDAGPPTIVFQPIAELATGQVVSYEALTRFAAEPQRPPDQWFTEASEVGRGVELELASVMAALAEAERLPPEVGVSINVSPAAATSPDLVDLLGPERGRRLLLEITEHERIDDYESLLDALGRLREAGVRLAVDDAGAGFSSLQHILTLRPDVIKLDISLTRDIDQDPIKRALASSLVSFSADIGSRLVAEGIETESERTTLVDLGVPWGQGYHLGRPAPLDAIVGSPLS